MARKNHFVRTGSKNIYELETASGKIEYYTSFMLDGVNYQKKNLTKMYGATKEKQAREALEFVKTELRQGRDPFVANKGDKVKDVILASIEDRKPKVQGKDNTKYKKNLESFYYLHIDPVIGHLKLGKVAKHHAQKILDNLDGSSKSHKTLLKTLMYKVFEDEFRAGNIQINPFYDLNYGSENPDVEFDDRFDKPIKKIAKKIYKASLKSNMPHRLIFLLSIMTSRRIGELYELKFSHFGCTKKGKWYVRTTFDITKTGIEERYPLPDEVVELLPDGILDRELEDERLFNFCYSGIFLKYTKMLKDANLDFGKNNRLTLHDNRKLFATILSEKGIDSALVDRCISHKKKTIQSIYNKPTYKTREKVFEQWWEFLRS